MVAMTGLPLGWATDVAVLEHTGSTVEDLGDHLVVRTPHNPTFHWGNWVLVTDPDAVDDARRWVRAFQAAIPSATWVAIGLVRMPGDGGAWAAEGLELGLDDVLVAGTPPRATALAGGYTARRLAGDDWDQVVARELAENDRTSESEPSSFERFVRARTRAQRALSDRDVAAFFGAFSDGVLVADLGVVRCGATARYQNVETDARYRRRGLASHLLGIAARWAADHGCDRWVIVTEAANPAGRVYRNLGFELDVANVTAYRQPPG
jgi:GNAT superfamily N-acetyltransferase